MVPRICLLTLIGLPAAGKTRLSSWLLQQQAALNNCNIIHLCYDDYFTLPTAANETVYKEQRAIVFELLRQLIAALKYDILPGPQLQRAAPSTSSDNYLIVCDDNHYYRSMRYKLYQLCRVHGCAYAQVHLASDLSTCLQRNASRENRLPDSVLQQMQARLEAPNLSAWECNSLTLDNEPSDAAIIDFIKAAFEKPLSLAVIPTKQPQLQSLAHQLDLRLRARINSRLQASDEKRFRCQSLNAQRRHILTEFKASQQANADVDLDYYVNLLI